MTLIVAGNWKMFAARSQVDLFVSELAAKWLAADEPQPEGSVQTVIFPPAGYLAQLSTALQAQLAGNVFVGAQNVHPEAEGAFTGEMSAAMLADLGVQWVLAGHSERRALFAEDDAFVAAKVASALAAGLQPVLCVGETLAEREAGKAEQVVCGQVDAVVDHVGADAFAQVVVAYEPVWAIGTGLTATPDQAQAMHWTVRERLFSSSPELGKVAILYGGSVKPDNAAELFAQVDIDGALIGGASLAAASFWAIIECARAEMRKA